MTKITYIPGEIANAAIDENGNRKPVTRTQHIFDDAKGKSQSEVNADVDDTFESQQEQINAERERAGGVESSLNTRLETVEQLAEISIGGGDIGIGTAADFESDNPSDLAKVPTVGAMLGGANDGVYDISARHSGTKYADLEAALGTNGANVPVGVRKGGMSVKYVQTSDNKYVQYRLMADEFTTDTKQWAIADEGVYVENPEFVYVKTDREGKILWAIKTDGSIYYGAGVPQQVVDYIDSKIAELSLDEYEGIVVFLNDIWQGDKTLQELLNEKVDKVEGKSLIDEEYAASQSAIENSEYLNVTTDSEGKILEGIKTDGTKVVGSDAQIGGNTILRGNATIRGKVDIHGATYTLQENPEWIKVLTDAQDRIIAGVRKDGSVYIGQLEGIPVDIQTALDALAAENVSLDERLQALESIISVNQNPEFISVEVDADNKILSGRRTDGTKFEALGLEVQKKLSAEHLVVAGTDITDNAEAIKASTYIKDHEGRIEVKTDSEDKIISYRDRDGVLHEEVGIELSNEGLSKLSSVLRKGGYLGMNNWSNNSYIHLPEKPKCAVINISGITNMPTTKTDDLKAYMEVWDKFGNYFKKKVIINAQGRTSLKQAKKNFAIDFCEDNWKGDDTTTIKIGDWVSQDSFHFKAYYTDLFKFANVISYKIWDTWKETLPITENRPYKEYFGKDYSSTTDNISDFTQNVKDEARCTPDGFPVMVYLNGEFYGLFSWQLKKHRDNYFLDRNDTNNIHLDGEDYINMFNGTINWTKVEVRNPKPKKSKWTMYCMDGSKYDGDAPKELIDNTSENWDGTNTSHIKSAQVKENIIAMSHYLSEIEVYESAYINASPEDKPAALATLKTEIEKRFGMKWVIDYILLINLENNGDAILQNTQWITWGKQSGTMKWYPLPYDLDASFGILSTTSFRFAAPNYREIGINDTTPISLAYKYFSNEMQERWAELRDKKLVDKNTIIGYIKEWITFIGFDNLKLEYEKWNESPCNRSSLINSKWNYTANSFLTYDDLPNSWYFESTFSIGKKVKYQHGCYESLQNNNQGHAPIIGEDTEWWKYLGPKAKTYNQGEIVWDGYSNFYAFEATETITVTTDASSKRDDHLINTPFENFYSSYPREGGCFDSIYRIYEWLESQISLMDTALNYNN